MSKRQFQRGMLIRRNAPDIPKPPRGILAWNFNPFRKARTLKSDTVASDGVSGYEVLVKNELVLGRKETTCAIF
jgi:hypothetical protein